LTLFLFFPFLSRFTADLTLPILFARPIFAASPSILHRPYHEPVLPLSLGEAHCVTMIHVHFKEKKKQKNNDI